LGNFFSQTIVLIEYIVVIKDAMPRIAYRPGDNTSGALNRPEESSENIPQT
jgi:hypothetical protein